MLQNKLLVIFQDPRRLDPRRVGTAAVASSIPTMEDANSVQSEIDDFLSLNKPSLPPVVRAVEKAPALLVANLKNDDSISELPLVSGVDKPDARDEVLSSPEEMVPVAEINASSDHPVSPLRAVDEDMAEVKLSNVEMKLDSDNSSLLEYDQHSHAISNMPASEEICQELPLLPSYVKLTKEQEKNVRKLAVERIIGLCKNIHRLDYSQMRMALLARLVAQVGLLSAIGSTLFRCSFSFRLHDDTFSVLLMFSPHIIFFVEIKSVKCILTRYQKGVPPLCSLQCG